MSSSQRPILRVLAIATVALTASSVAQAAEPAALPTAAALAELPPDGGPNFNRLVFETSPYLLQHAANPVDWYPWGDEAFELARAKDKPLFLSIGYSTCHWCHVMERESFEDAEVAALLNEHFVCIKVDREERPDIDQVYMAASIATRRSGGWPQSVFMTSDERPFHMASYIPKASRPNRIGMLDLLPEIAEVWKTNRRGILAAAREAVAKLEQFNGGAAGEDLDLDTLTMAYEHLSERYDPRNGGFTISPKFPPTHHLSFLLRYWRRTGNENALAMVEHTLDNMARGGIFDHIGQGFHRYAIDDHWNVPHFEKMLYDQAMLAMTYAEAFQATGNESYRDTARKICDYVLEDLTSPDGAFYAARDADSEGEEGKFYTWTVNEVLDVLGDERGREFIAAYNFEVKGNYNDQATGEPTGSNVPNLKRPLYEIAHELGVETRQLQRRLQASRKILFKHREERIPPMRDETILADWNGLMTMALAKCGQALSEPRYTAAAMRSADFILENLLTRERRLLHRFRNGAASNAAHLEDYAFVVWALLEVYEATFEIRFLQSAIDLNTILLHQFWDVREGGFFMTAHDDLLVRPKEAFDRARPSGNSVAALNLLRIARMTGEAGLEERAHVLFRAFALQVRQTPSAFTQLLIALDLSLGPSYEVVIAGTPGAPDTGAMIQALRQAFVPNKVVLFRPDTDEAPTLTSIAPFTANQKTLGGKATAYVCRNYTCKAPTTRIAEMLAALRPELARLDH